MSPRSKAQLSAIKAEKRNLIISASLKVFSEQGYQASSISNIAAEAGISKGLIYTYFDSKEDLLRSLLFETIENMFEVSINALSGNPTKYEFVQMIRDNIEWVKENSRFSKIYFGLLLQPNIINMFHDELMALAQPFFVSISRYFELAGCDNPMLETRYFVSVLDGVYMNYIMDPDSYPLKEIENKIIDQIVDI
ncbi:TetR/AcrR family transcriptional regulator [Saccharicrinis sp. GN24d3]|uniref:TetR/AcrR family transcriptional regulator n=1 Tax=Saccharicrinis sp. GN24d3 TaxID=3458416 RepID=UPI0040369636